MDKKQENDILRRISMEKNGGFDGWFIFCLVLAVLAAIFGVLFVVYGFLFPDGEGMAIFAYIGCALVPVAVVLTVIIFARRKMLIKRYNGAYQKWKSKSRDERWKWLQPKEAEKPSAAAKALQEAAKRAAWGHGSSSSYTPSASSTSDSSMRVKMKDGSELHTEERFGDYKTYLYDKDGKNTGLHVQGDRVLDDNYNEVGHFDGSGKFIPKN